MAAADLFLRDRIHLARPDCALCDPFFKSLDFRSREALTLRRHFHIIVCAADDLDKVAARRITRNNCRTKVSALQQRRAAVQSQPGFLLLRPVALETAICENGQDFLFKIGCRSLRISQRSKHQGGEECEGRSHGASGIKMDGTCGMSEVVFIMSSSWFWQREVLGTVSYFSESRCLSPCRLWAWSWGSRGWVFAR